MALPEKEYEEGIRIMSKETGAVLEQIALEDVDSDDNESRKNKDRKQEPGGKIVYYVVQVRSGDEERCMREFDLRIKKDILRECFVPHYEEKKKINGRWMLQQRILFPGYMFLETDDIDELYLNLRAIPRLTKLLGVGEYIVPLNVEEEAFLMRFGGKNHLVEMSEGIIEHSQVRILSGPLMGMEGMIKKIDRHKRKAWLEMELFGRIQMVEVGLEVVLKTI